MPDKIRRNLAHAFAEESGDSARYEAFYLKAAQEGYPNLARLFKAVAEAKSVHARRLLLLIRGKIGTTEENLKAAVQRESSAFEKAYPRMVEDAGKASKAIKKAFAQSMKTNGESAQLYRKAMSDPVKKEEPVYYVCQICGHVSIDHVPENCPVCKAVPGRFRKVMPG